MTLVQCKNHRRYKRPHWTDYHIMFNTDTSKWIYDNGSPIGEVVNNTMDLIECHSDGTPAQPIPVKVVYESDAPYDMIVCVFPNSPTKEYEYKIDKGTVLIEGQPLVTETGGKLGIAHYKRTIQHSMYHEDKLAWIFGTVVKQRDANKSLSNEIISSIVNKGL